MSFLAPDNILPFSIVDPSNPPASVIGQTVTTDTTVTNPDPNSVLQIDQGSNLVSVNNGTDTPVPILLNGSGTTLLITGGPANILGTDVNGGGQVIEILPTEDNFIIEFRADPSNPNLQSVDLSKLVGGNEEYEELLTIDEAGGGQAAGTIFYAHASDGDDQLFGSNVKDFLRGGAGDDIINAGGGDDLVRGGAGSDQIFLGAGNDILYYTIDQLDSTDFVEDFTAGEDLITFDASLNLSFSGFGTNELTVQDDAGNTLKIVSGASVINEDDIDFV